MSIPRRRLRKGEWAFLPTGDEHRGDRPADGGHHLDHRQRRYPLDALQYPRTAEERDAFQPVVRRRLDDLADSIPKIRDGLAAAVLYGTARSAYDPELSIYGKTGTCSENGARLGWFVSYAGELQPQYVVVVLLRGGRMMFARMRRKLPDVSIANWKRRRTPLRPAGRIFASLACG